ncbi:MAG: alpha/beta hydrolase [Armatimonadota bacterium]
MAPERTPLWNTTPPGPTGGDGNERDTSAPTDGRVAGRTVIRLTGVASASIDVHLPPVEKRTGAGIVVCPGGGFHILAMDLEGTEVAEWLNGLGVAAFVLRYRTPTASGKTPSTGPAIDAQRALRTVRSRAREWGVRPDRVGILGFSAGGKTAAVAMTRAGKPLYEPVDAIDREDCRADFGILVYPAWLVDDRGAIAPENPVGPSCPPCFLAHAADDPIPAASSIGFFTALRGAKVPAELHVWESGGHGYGLRPNPDQPVTTWPARCEAWLRTRRLLGKA